MLITFEGVDGVGKTSQVTLLREYLDGRHIDNISLREPGGSQAGETIRTLVKSDHTLSDKTLLFLFEAARSHLIETQINPLLAQGTVVILDRFYDSTTVYQGFPNERTLYPATKFLNLLATGGLEPDITFLLDSPAEVNIARLAARNENPDAMDAVNLAHHRRLQNEFILLWKSNKDRIKLIDANKPQLEVHAAILDYIYPLIHEV